MVRTMRGMLVGQELLSHVGLYTSAHAANMPRSQLAKEHRRKRQSWTVGPSLVGGTPLPAYNRRVDKIENMDSQQEPFKAYCCSQGFGNGLNNDGLKRASIQWGLFRILRPAGLPALPT